MVDVPIDESAIRRRLLDVLNEILGYRPDPEMDQLTDLDSLQVLELLVSLEEEFEVDSDLIIGTRTDWWSSLSGLVTSIGSLLPQSSAETAAQA